MPQEVVPQEEMSSVMAIRRFFSEGARPVSLDELKQLDTRDKEELGVLCASALGVRLKSRPS
jgi:hypothetical protein